MNMMWFNNKRDEGVIYQDYFNPIAIPAIALILTAVSFLFVQLKNVLMVSFHTSFTDWMQYRRVGDRD